MEFLKLLPKNLLSQVVGGLVSIEKPQALAIKARDWFIERYKINMNEAELPLEAYPSISKLFIRKLKPGVRPLGEGVVHPCDAFITVAESIDYDTLIQAKGKKYSLTKLLQDDKAPHVYAGGTHIVYYLCPTDYHRVHAPIDGFITKVVHVPGNLWPVNEWSVAEIPELFCVNERVIFHFETALGPMALVMVGATNVGQISVSFDRSIVTNRVAQDLNVKVKKYSKPIEIRKGDEIGVFHMGSTVVMICPQNMISVIPHKHKVQMGASV